jgi:uncharacterized membrane protein
MSRAAVSCVIPLYTRLKVGMVSGVSFGSGSASESWWGIEGGVGAAVSQYSTTSGLYGTKPVFVNGEKMVESKT